MKIYLAINDGYISKPLGAYPSLKMAKFAVEFLRQDTKKFTQEELDNYGPQNLISAYWSSDKTWGHAILAGICDQPHSFVDTLREEMTRFLTNSLEVEDFERLKRAAWGATISSLQSPASLASVALNNLLNETTMFDAINISSPSISEILFAFFDKSYAKIFPSLFK